MILTELNIPQKGIENLQLAVKYYLNSDSEILKNGKYPIYEDKLIAIVSSYKTRSLDHGLWESHRKYVDIQYMITGTELMGVNNIGQMQLKRPYREEDDCLFYEGTGELITLKEGTMAVFTPWDAHMPGIHTDHSAIVKKLIFKVDIDFLDFSPELIFDFARAY